MTNSNKTRSSLNISPTNHFDTIHNVSNYVTLVQFVDIIGYFIHEITISGVYIFDTEYKHSFHLSWIIKIYFWLFKNLLRTV